MRRDSLKDECPPLAAFIDNDNIMKSLREQYESSETRGYDIEKIVKFLQDEGDLRIGKVYLNPGDFQNPRKKSLLHKLNMNLFEPVYTDAYKYKSLTDPNMIWDIAKVFHEQPEIKKFAIISGDKDFLPIMKELHASGKEGVLMYVDGSEAKDLRKTAEKIGWKTYEVPIYR